jgi:Flp pilus assembly pilin Flp
MKKIIQFALIFTIKISFAQTQVGADINGEAANDQSGFSVATSQLGTVVAIGAPRNGGNGANSGQVRVYRNASGTWTQHGVDINGDTAEDRFGSAVAINSTGSIIVVGAPLYSSTNNGRVKVFSNSSGSNYTLVGSAIEGFGNNSAAGSSVAISANGSIVAIGAPTYSLGATNRGAVRVYQNVSGTWTQVGGTIQGSAVERRLGTSVALSSDGTILAVGTAGNGTMGYPGQVQIYRNVSGTWTQIGNDINGAANGDAFGQSVSLSSDGNTVAIGAPFNASAGTMRGQVKIFANNSNTWTQVGATINGEANNDQSGFSVSLSGNGSILAIGGSGNSNANGSFSGHARIYRNISGTWTQIGTDIDGEEGNDGSASSLSISSDGNYVSVGAPYNNGSGIDSGHVKVYSLVSLLSTNDFNKSNLKFNLYPNPANSILNIDLATELKSVEIYSLQGQKVLTATEKKVNISGLSIGIYMVKVEDENGAIATKKLVKE